MQTSILQDLQSVSFCIAIYSRALFLPSSEDPEESQGTKMAIHQKQLELPKTEKALKTHSKYLQNSFRHDTFLCTLFGTHNTRQ